MTVRFLRSITLVAGALQLEHVGVLPDRDDALPLIATAFRDRETVVDRDDPAVHEDRIGGVRCECGCNRGKPQAARTRIVFFTERFSERVCLFVPADGDDGPGTRSRRGSGRSQGRQRPVEPMAYWETSALPRFTTYAKTPEDRP